MPLHGSSRRQAASTRSKVPQIDTDRVDHPLDRPPASGRWPLPRAAMRRPTARRIQGANRSMATRSLPCAVIVTETRRAATARRIRRQTRSVSATSHAGIGSGASAWKRPELSTLRILLSTNPGLTSVTLTPARASSGVMD